MSVSSIDAAPFRVQAVPTEVRVLFAQILVEQATAQLVAQSVADQQALTKAAAQPDGTGATIDKIA